MAESNVDYPSYSDYSPGDPSNSPVEKTNETELESLLYARHIEVENFKDLTYQRGTPIPALFNQFYKFIQNPSTVSVETFKRMVDTDDTIGSGVDFLTTCLSARLGRYVHPSAEITEWVNKRLEEIDGGWTSFLKEMFSATWAGFVCAEKIWANTENGFVPKKLVALPPSSILFETERTGELTYDGILQYQRNYNPAFFQSGTNYLFGFGSFSQPLDRTMRPDPFAKLGDFPYPLRTANLYSYMAIRIPKQKVIHYAFDAQGRFGNPYGRSLLRRCYKYYASKDTFLQMLAIALDRKGTPLTVIFADPNTTVLDHSKTSVGVSNTGKKNGIRADLAVREIFKNIHNDTTVILPGKKGQVYDTEFVPQASNASDFIDSLKFCNQSIMRALLLPSLIFTGGDGTGSYSLGQEHAKTFDKILDGINAGVKQALLQQLIKEMIAYNFPESVWKKDGIGDFSKVELSTDEVQKEMEVIEKAVAIGAIDMNDLNDLNQIRDKIKFEPRDEIIEQPEPEMGDEPGQDEGAPVASPSNQPPKKLSGFRNFFKRGKQ